MNGTEWLIVVLLVTLVALLVIVEWLYGVAENLRAEVQHYRDEAIFRAKARIQIPYDVAKDFAASLAVKDLHRTPPTAMSDETPQPRKVQTLNLQGASFGADDVRRLIDEAGKK